MGRARPSLGTPFGTDGPWLAAILDVLGEIVDMLDARLPSPASAGGGEPGPGKTAPAAEPAPTIPPAGAVQVSEPAPHNPPDSDDDRPVEVTEPDTGGAAGPPPPPRRGKGSGLDVWRAFATTGGVKCRDDDGRDDIIAACVRAGVIDDE